MRNLPEEARAVINEQVKTRLFIHAIYLSLIIYEYKLNVLEDVYMYLPHHDIHAALSRKI